MYSFYSEYLANYLTEKISYTTKDPKRHYFDMDTIGIYCDAKQKYAHTPDLLKNILACKNTTVYIFDDIDEPIQTNGIIVLKSTELSHSISCDELYLKSILYTDVALKCNKVILSVGLLFRLCKNACKIKCCKNICLLINDKYDKSHEDVFTAMLINVFGIKNNSYEIIY
jgi:hypothetical protein